MPRNIRKLLVIAAVAALALAHLPAASRADESVPPAEDGPRTVVKYLTCATALAFSPNMATAIAALMTCAKMFTEEIPA